MSTYGQYYELPRPHVCIFLRQLSDKMKVAKIINIQLNKKIYCNTVLLWYIFRWGIVYILGIIPIFKIMVMCSTHTSHTPPTSRTFSPFSLRYQLRQTPTKSTISPLFTPSKITTNQPKSHLNPLNIKYFIEVNQKNQLIASKQQL